MAFFITEAFQRELHAWEKVDEDQLAKMRATLAAMVEESQSTLLLKKEREDFAVQEKLERTRKKVNERLDECKQKKQLFERKQAELRRVVAQNEQFIKDTDAKIDKAEKKAKEEAELMKKKQEEFDEVSRQKDELLEEKNVELKRIAANAHYKRYLEAVVQQNEDEFGGDVEDLLSRHKILQQSNIELRRQNDEVSARLDQRRDQWQRKEQKLQNEQLMMNSELHEAQMLLEKERLEKVDWENKLTGALEEKELMESHIGIIDMAIEQLYQRALASCRLPQRRNAMEEFVDCKYGQQYRQDLVLACVTERMGELLWIVDEAKAGLASRADGKVVQRLVEQDPAELDPQWVPVTAEAKPTKEAHDARASPPGSGPTLPHSGQHGGGARSAEPRGS